MLWADPSEKFVYVNSNNKVTSLLDRVSGNPGRPRKPIEGPIWRDNVINGKPILSFTNGQNLRWDINPLSAIRGVNVPVSITCLVQDLGTADGSVVDLGHKALINPEQGFILFGGVTSYRFDDHSNVSGDFGNAVIIDKAPHVVTYLFDGKNIIIRIDGRERDAIPNTLTGGNFSCDQFAIGDVTDAFFFFGGSFPFIGNLGMVAVYQGKTASVEVESFFKDYYGL